MDELIPSGAGIVVGMPRVLLIEDDEAVRNGLSMALGGRGLTVEAVATGEEGLAMLASRTTDVVVLDLMLPGLDGFEVCRRIRAAGDLPIIMLTARNDDIDVVAGLAAGADDYVVKPARAQVIEARIRAVLRRSGQPSRPVGPGIEQHGDLGIDRAGLSVTKGGEPVGLAPTELRLLLELSQVTGRVLSRQYLLESVWEHGYFGDSRVVDACVQRLRAKIEDDSSAPVYVQTVRGFGYRFGPL
ncbi:response regulator transcription factor [Amycolatopsis regifaucium]|uniref:DNA-binding response regulator n=1 Tax=Amycolatopsis regifaucium TaxID=546365 RepID=A0A154MYP5_9PSEU|nr:response regulator transcription factor [Amycolatopsis regifaucium]KZB88589.1 two-component system response regulator [Amycolatopsis regifaucium]OKA07240.1 DNA-binding response regulator [Amycolatopsis regifaucium]SFI52555.1 DNA-binding response regulator, OmpR family, contains REC and winged-helix (wHTH) domain [Amycolatopsis regifaucium]